MITKYIIPEQFGDLEIVPTKIIMEGYAGAPLVDDQSLGGFYVDLVLVVGVPPNPLVKKGVRVEHSSSQPVDTTSLESIKEWALAQLDAQYGVPE